MLKDEVLVEHKDEQDEQEPFALIRADGKIELCSQAFADLVGYTPDELKNMPWDNIVNRSEGQEDLGKLSGTDESPCLFVKECICKDGSRIAVELQINVIRDPRGQVQYFCVFARDIKEKKGEKDVMQKIERGHFSLMGQWPGFVYRCANDRNWTMKWIYGDFKAVTGYDSEEVIDNKVISWAKIIHPDDYERTLDVAQVGMNESRPFQQEYRIVTKDGKIKWILEMNIGVSNSKGEEFFEGFITDITERKQAEEQIKTILTDSFKSLQKISQLNKQVIYVLQEFVNNKEQDHEKIRQYIETMLCIQSKTCRLINNVNIDFSGFDLLAQEIEFIFDGKEYFYPKITSIFSDSQ